MNPTPRARAESKDREGSVRSVRSNQSAVSLSDSTKDGQHHTTLRAGAMLGLDTFFLRHPDIPTHKYVVSVRYLWPQFLSYYYDL
jgi:hypothetical protein